MYLLDATNYFFAKEAGVDAPMLELTHNHDRRELYDSGDGYSHVAFTVNDPEGTVAKLKEQGMRVTLELKTRPSRATTTA